MVRYFSYRRNG